MWIIALVLLGALLIPILGILLDSPIGRAFARRVEGNDPLPLALSELTRKVELLESEVDDLTRGLESLKDENAFLQRLIEDTASRPQLPPGKAT